MLLKSTCCTNIKLSCTNIYTVKLAHVVTSIKQSPVLNHNFLALSLENSIQIEPLQDVTCLIMPLFLCPKGDLIIQG